MNLPKVRTSGFTLVELMIVIAIIAVLSVIGVTIFSGIQKDSRDARRRADIDAIASAMEANYGKTTAGRYDPLLVTFFASGTVPTDPTDTPGAAAGNTCPAVCQYCVTKGTTAQTPAACNFTSTDVAAATPALAATENFWMVCANLEKTSGTFYCRGNQQ